jgi:hypothetical protein
MVLSIGCLIAPSMQHRMSRPGNRPRVLSARHPPCGLGLLPFIASLGLGLFIVFERIFGGVTASRSASPAPHWQDFSGSASHG